MTRENRNLLINTILVLIVSSVLLLTFMFYVPTTSADKVFNTKVVVKDKGYFRLPPKIDKIEDVYNKKDEHIGVLYTVSDENAYGPITLKVAINDKGIILGVYQLVEQNYPESHHSLEVHKYVKSLVGSRIENPQNLDGVAKPTTSITLGTINNILDIIAVHAHFKKPDAPITDPVEIYEVLSEDLDRLESVNFEGEIIEEKYEGFDSEGNLLGNFYMANATNNFGNIRVIAFVDKDMNVVMNSYDVNQTMNLDAIKDFINGYSSFEDELDGFAGVTFSKESFEEIVEAIKESEESGSVITADIELLDETDGISTYLVGGEYFYFNADGYISFEFSVNENLELTKFEVVEYEHTSGNFKDNVINFLEDLVAENIKINEVKSSNSDVDINTGSTNTTKGVVDLLDNLARFIESEGE